MGKNVEHIQHVKSNVVLNGKPKLPNGDVLVEGELAINYASGYETISLKNASGEVITFSSDEYYSEKKLGSGFTGANSALTVTDVITENEEIVAAALNDLNENKQDVLSAGTGIQISGNVISVLGGGGAVDQVIDSGTSASTNAVSTSAVYGFVTSYTPSITVDQILDDSVSASTNPVSSKAVYDAVTDNELVWTNAYVTLSGAISSHTEDTSVHVTSADKEKLNSITGAFGTMAYQNANSYSSATEVNTALGSKANSTDLNAYADSVKYNSTSHYVEFYHGGTGGTKVFEYDASPFIIDGMVQNVEIKDVASSGTCLVVSFNTDAGKQDINIPISDIFDASNYYDKDDIDNLVGSGFTVSSITDVIISDERITAAALNDLNTSKLDASAYTPTDLSNYYTKSETSGASQISTALNDKASNAAFTAHTGDTSIHHTHSNKTYLDGITGAVGTMAYQNASSYSSATQVNTALTGKSDTGHTHDDRYYTEAEIDTLVGSGYTSSSITEVIENMDAAIAAALTDLETNKLDTSAYTPTDLSNYYTKGETSGASQISTALNDKASNAAFTAHTADSTSHLTSTEKSQLHTHTNKTYLDGITGAVGTMIYQNSNSYSSATQVSTALGDKADKATTIAGYGITDAKIANQVITLGANSVTVSSATQVNTALGDKADNSSFTDHTASTVHMSTTEKTNLDSLATNIGTISGVTSTKVSNWDAAATNSHTHSNKTYLDGITGSVGTMAYQNASSYSSATQVNTALANKSDISHTHASSAITSMVGYTSGSSTSAISTNDTLNQAIGKLECRLGGLKLIKLTQQEYDALSPNYDPNTLYVIID